MAGLPDGLIRLIQTCVPTYQAAEVLLFFAARPERAFAPEEVVVSMRPVVVTVPAVKQYLAVFTAAGLLVEAAGTFTYGPSSPELEQSIGELGDAYNERPVTLIKVIHEVADSRIQSFADAFKLRKE